MEKNRKNIDLIFQFVSKKKSFSFSSILIIISCGFELCGWASFCFFYFFIVKIRIIDARDVVITKPVI